MNIDIDLVKKCFELDKINMAGKYLDGSGNLIQIDRIEDKMLDALKNGAILRSYTKDKKVKGYFIYRIKDREAVVFSIQVENPGSNSYILKELLRIAFEELQRVSFDFIRTSVDKRNIKSLALHQGLGFEAFKEKENSISFKVSRLKLKRKLEKFNIKAL